jgi:hypothetical protein
LETGKNGLKEKMDEQRFQWKGGVLIMDKGVVETKDLWQSAFIFTEGGTLEGVRVEKKANGRKEVVFVLSGSMSEMLLKNYDSGIARCNVVELRSKMSHLKDVIFRRIDE